MLLEELLNERKAETLYVCRHLIDTDDLKKWAKEQGFKTILDDKLFHTTIQYSKTKVEWTKSMEEKNELVVKGGKRKIERFGDAVVLTFQSDDLHDRWKELKNDLGSHWKFPTYRPHITLTWDGEYLDTEKIAPFKGELKFGPEKFVPIEDNWEDDIKEQSLNENIITEIEGGVELNDDDILNKLSSSDYDERQNELFPDLPKVGQTANDLSDSEEVGSIGTYKVRMIDNPNDKTFVLQSGSLFVGYIRVEDEGEYYGCNAVKVTSVRIADAFRGKNIATQLYRWLLLNECELIFSDDSHTNDAKKLWQRFVEDRTFEVYRVDVREDAAPRRIKTVKGLKIVYDYDNISMFLVLPGTLDA